MLLLKFFQTIDDSFIGKLVEKRLNIIGNTDPQRIYVENIRSFYNFTTPVAKSLCEMAVRQNLFKKMHSMDCPECGKPLLSNTYDEDFPEQIECDTCLMLEKEKYEFSKKECKETIFYKLNVEVYE